MGEKFDMSVALPEGDTASRDELLRALDSWTAPVMGSIRWMMRLNVSSSRQEDAPWASQALELLPGDILCFYPLPRSSLRGAILLNTVHGRDVWTWAVPVTDFETDPDAVLEVMWRMSDWGLPCIAGNEYTMEAVLHEETDPLAEAATPGSLATHLVTLASSGLGWPVASWRGDRVLMVRPDR